MGDSLFNLWVVGDNSSVNEIAEDFAELLLEGRARRILHCLRQDEPDHMQGIVIEVFAHEGYRVVETPKSGNRVNPVDRHDHIRYGSKAIDREQTEAGWAIDQHELIGIPQALDRLAKPVFPAPLFLELQGCIREIARRRKNVELRNPGRADRIDGVSLSK